MATVTRLAGAARRIVNLRSNELGRVITITLVEGETLPEGDLVAEATFGEYDQVLLTATELGGSGPVEVEVELLPDDFESYGNRDWVLEVFVEDAGSGSDPEETKSILFDGILRFRVVEPLVVQSTTITTISGSGS